MNSKAALFVPSLGSTRFDMSVRFPGAVFEILVGTMANSSARKLRSIPGGKAKPARDDHAVDELLSGRVRERPKNRARKKELPAEEIPKQLLKLADVFAAARSIEKEIRVKGEYARQQLDRFWREQLAKQYAVINRRPASRTFTGKHSRFKFVFTERTTLTAEKIDELKDMDIPIEEYTEVRGVQISYDAIRQHGLVNKLREALSIMHLPKGVLEEVFTPQVQLKESFYDILTEIVRSSLKMPGKQEGKQPENQQDKFQKKLQEKLGRVLEILNKRHIVNILFRAVLDILYVFFSNDIAAKVGIG